MPAKNRPSPGGMTDMTTGNPARLIMGFAIPLLIGNIFQQLYNMVDSIVVGRFVGSVALAAVGTSFPIIFLMSSLFIGLSMGATVMISQFYGAKDIEQVKRTVDTIYSAMMVGVLPLTLISVLLSGPILRLVRVPEDTLPSAQIYMVIVFLGIIGTLGFNINSGILQGFGDSKTPLLFLSIACVINIVLDLFLVLVIPMGVAGVAVATIIAQIFSWVFGIFYINRKYTFLHITPFKFKFNPELFKQAMRLGIPSGIQQALFSMGTLAIQSLVNSYGSTFMAGFNGANKLDTFAFMPIQSFTNATTTYVGQNIGAGLIDRVKRGTRSAMTMSVVASIILGGGVMLTGSFLMQLFSEEPGVIAAGVAYLNRVLPFYILLSILFILNAVMRGAGESVIPMFTTSLSLLLVRVPCAYLFAHFFGRDSIFFSYAAGWSLGVMLSLFFYLKGDWKKKGIVRPVSSAD